MFKIVHVKIQFIKYDILYQNINYTGN